MKLTLLFLAVCGLACGAVIPATKEVSDNSKTLLDDWAEFVALLPRGEIINILVEHLAEDEEFQNIILYIISDEFEAIVVDIDNEPAFLAILDYLEEQGLTVYDFLNVIHDFLGIPPINRPTMQAAVKGIIAHAQKGVQKGWRDMWEEIKAVLPMEEMYNWHCGKLADGEDWSALYDSLQADEFRVLLNAFRVTDSWQAFLTKLAELDVQTDLVVAAIQKFFNWDEDNIDYCVNFTPSK